MSNKDYVDAVLDKMSEEDQDALAKFATMRVIDFYLLPGREVDMMHRIFRRTITLRRGEYLAAMQAAMEEKGVSLDGVDDSEDEPVVSDDSEE